MTTFVWVASLDRVCELHGIFKATHTSIPSCSFGIVAARRCPDPRQERPLSRGLADKMCDEERLIFRGALLGCDWHSAIFTSVPSWTTTRSVDCVRFLIKRFDPYDQTSEHDADAFISDVLPILRAVSKRTFGHGVHLDHTLGSSPIQYANNELHYLSGDHEAGVHMASSGG